jgi:hypothetical protein
LEPVSYGPGQQGWLTAPILVENHGAHGLDPEPVAAAFVIDQRSPTSRPPGFSQRVDAETGSTGAHNQNDPRATGKSSSQGNPAVMIDANMIGGRQAELDRNVPDRITVKLRNNVSQAKICGRKGLSHQPARLPGGGNCGSNTVVEICLRHDPERRRAAFTATQHPALGIENHSGRFGSSAIDTYDVLQA